MAVTFPEYRIGDPAVYESLVVFPLFAPPGRGVDYDLSDDAIGRGTVTVEEVSESGSVPDLAVENQGDRRVLFLEGEQLIGAKQNRILNTSVLIAARSRSKIPVSCVEQGRWGYKSRQFGSSGSHSPAMLRKVLKGSVSCSLKSGMGHRSDQGEIWREVSRQQSSLGARSGTSAMSDTFDTYRHRLSEFQEHLPYVDGAVGVAVALGDHLVAIDVFDKPETCRKVWTRLLSGVILDALEREDSSQQAQAADVQRVLKELETLSWEPAQSIGEGNEFRGESPAGDMASALVLDDVLVHGSVVLA
jgi:hypothetical protein